MPVYSIATNEPLPQDKMNAIADAMTNIHCGLTDAPSEFMNVIFMTGNTLKGGKKISLNANIREGGNRGQDLLDTMHHQLQQSLMKIMSLPAKKTEVNLIGFQASWAIEGGMILPDPGDDEAWLQRKTVKQH